MNSSTALRRGRLVFRAVLIAATLALGGCLGDSDDDDDGISTGTGSVPDSAGASASAFIAFVGSLVSDDQAEPLSLGDFTAPIDDANEPEVVGT